MSDAIPTRSVTEMITPVTIASCVGYLFAELPDAEQFPAMAAAGFTATEWHSPYALSPEAAAATLERNGLTAVQILVPERFADNVYGTAGVPGAEAEFRANLDTAIRYATAMGSPLVGVLPGQVPPGVDRGPYLDTLCENLAMAADLAAKDGLTLSFEPVARVRVSDCLVTTIGEAADVLARVARPNITLVFDTFHVRMEGDLVAETFEAHADDIGLVQIANAPGRNEPGAGELDIPYFIERVRSTGWIGWMSCEYRPSTGDTLQSLAWASPYGIG